MHICLCGTELCSVLDAAGGLEKCIRIWAEGLSRYCHVTLIDICNDSTSFQEGVRKVTLDPKIAYLKCSETAELPLVLNSLRADVVQLNNRPLLQTGIATIVTFHNYPYAWSPGQIADPVRLKKAVSKRYLTAVSKALLSEVSNMTDTSCVGSSVLNPPIATEFFSQRHLGGDGVLFASRLMAKKGVALATEAILAAKAAEKAIFLDTTTPFLKDTQEYRDMKKLITSAGITLKPAAEGVDEMAAYYAKADVVLQISLTEEGLGLIPLEAQAVGANVIAAGPGGLEETIFKPNLFFKKPSVDVIASSISHFLARPMPSKPQELDIYKPEKSTLELLKIAEYMSSLDRS